MDARLLPKDLPIKKLFLEILLAACGGHAGMDDGPDAGDDLGQAEQDISVRPYYGVAETLGFGSECTPTDPATCMYPDTKVIGVRLDTATGFPTATEKAQAQTALTEVITRFNTSAPGGWSVTQLFGAAGSVANLTIGASSQGTWPPPPFTLDTWMLGTHDCVAWGALLTESPSIPGQHRFCGKRAAFINMDQIMNMSAASRVDLFEHIIGSFVMAAAGRGTSAHTPNQTYYSAGRVLPIGKTGPAPWDVCFLNSYSLSNPTVINRSTLTCP